MNLDAFTQLPQAVAAGLKRAHVLAIRLYTSPVFQNISKPLHDGCSPTRPDPYPALVALLTEALKKVRTEQLNRERTNPDELLPHRVLWRGVSKLGDVTSEFKQRGGTEISPMSNSFDRKVAETRALQEYITQRALEASTPKSPNASELSTPTLLKLRIDNFAAAGVDVSKFSVLPDEGEGESEESSPNPHRASLLYPLSPHYLHSLTLCLLCASLFLPCARTVVYPPCTYLEPKGEKDETIVGPSDEEFTVKIIEVVPSCP